MNPSNEVQGNQSLVYFPNLNGLRFIAAFFVIIFHIEQFRQLFDLENNMNSPFIRIIGDLGVILFFVLSGFLITFLLLEEQRIHQTISIKNFYIRRILRIWPLYFFVVALALFVLPSIPLFSISKYETLNVEKDLLYKIFLFLCFLPNWLYASGYVVPYAVQTWSIGTEEQFYLFWPVLIKKIKNKFYLMLGVMCFYWSFKYLIVSYSSYFSRSLGKSLVHFCYAIPIDTMATGGLFALFLFYKKEKILKILFSSIVQIVVLLLLVFLIGNGYRIPYFFYGVLFSIVILNLSGNPQTLLRFENKPMDYLGKISYGLYMYHSIAIVLAIVMLKSADLQKNTYFVYFYSLGLSLIFSSISYEYFEKRILKWKLHFSTVVTGEVQKTSII